MFSLARAGKCSSHTLVSVHLLDRRGNHFSSNPLINLPKGGKKQKKNPVPATAKPISCASHAKASVQPFSRSASRCSCSLPHPDAWVLLSARPQMKIRFINAPGQHALDAFSGVKVLTPALTRRRLQHSPVRLHFCPICDIIPRAPRVIMPS